MIIICDAPGQTCNRLWSYAASIAECIVKKKRLMIIFYDWTIEDFPNLLHCPWIYFPLWHKWYLERGNGWNNYKGLTWKGVWGALDQCVDTLSIVLILIATSNAFGYMLTKLHVPSLAANLITGVSDNPYVIAILLNVILLVLGMIMDMAPIILISTPILLPIATSIGIDPIQYGIMLVLNCGIGLLTPPVGAVLFIGSAIAEEPMEKVVKAQLPFYVMMIIALILITFVPAISLVIPNLLGY
jgi:tripartite ATP-independent transporter DctM subunit